MRRSMCVVGLAVSLGLFSGCRSGGSSPSGPSEPSPPAGGGEPPLVIDIVGDRGTQSFVPNPVSVPAGRRVVWRNTDTQVHQIRFDDQSVDTGSIPPGGTSPPVDAGVARRTYHCPLHPGMVGTLNDTTQAEPSPCDGGDPYCY